jgi:hypothetical protein
MLKTINIDLQLQPLIDHPPQTSQEIYNKAASGDDATIHAWRETWIKRKKEAKEFFGSLGSKSAGVLHGINRHRPAIICGSGPSLKTSIPALKENQAAENPILTISCLHNFGYFEDEGIHADYYLSLDAGDVVLNDVHEGRKHLPGYYWEKTKEKKLIACIMTPKELFEKWQGEIYLFHVMIPEIKLQNDLQSIERFAHYFSCGGNALGACLYAAQCLMGSHVIHFVGADFCFDYDDKFHSYSTHYDQPGNYIRWPDIYGIPRKTWASYFNFKCWFDWVAMNIPGRYVNCSEGILGSYPTGNMKHFEYMPLEKALIPYLATERVFLEKRNPDGSMISKDKISLKELFADPQYPQDLALI